MHGQKMRSVEEEQEDRYKGRYKGDSTRRFYH